MSNPIAAYLKQFEGQPDVTIFNETLQKADDPVAELKKVTTRAVIVVPDEWNWPPNLQPFKNNPTHKRFYDADLLAEHLHEAGLEPYILRQIDFAGWSFCAAEAIRKLNSKERRRLERQAKFSTAATSAGTSNSGISPESKPATPQGTNPEG